MGLVQRYKKRFSWKEKCICSIICLAMNRAFNVNFKKIFSLKILKLLLRIIKLFLE